ncbi:MAG: methylated-DNA--[protein]-cysteine S-methyltransferase [Rhodanobacteraceae bacterium]
MQATHAKPDCMTANDPRWSRVLARDASAGGEFFYSVSSTGVYCRPSCPSRGAKPEHVAFHATPEAARRAGFRPCKRCKPDRVRQHDALHAEIIRYALASSPLGLILVAATAHGVCAILPGDDADTLKADLRRRFHRAELREDPDALVAIVVRVNALIESPATAPCDLALDIRGTPFQRRVWQALRGIPSGSTTSYAQLAASLGSPRSARAVAQACGANPLAVAIPCHRVLRSDGALSGYRWGVQRKRALLRREGYPS